MTWPCFGPNGFVRGVSRPGRLARAHRPRPASTPGAASSSGQPAQRRDPSRSPPDVAPGAYIGPPPARLHRLAPGAEAIDAWDLKASHNWYDFIVTCAEAPSFQRRLAGHGEDGRPSLSDPRWAASA